MEFRLSTLSTDVNDIYEVRRYRRGSDKRKGLVVSLDDYLQIRYWVLTEILSHRMKMTLLPAPSERQNDEKTKSEMIH